MVPRSIYSTLVGLKTGSSNAETEWMSADSKLACQDLLFSLLFCGPLLPDITDHGEFYFFME